MCADLAGRIRNQLRARAFEAEQAYWDASESFLAARAARAAAIAAQRLARLQALEAGGRASSDAEDEENSDDDLDAKPAPPPPTAKAGIKGKKGAKKAAEPEREEDADDAMDIDALGDTSQGSAPTQEITRFDVSSLAEEEIRSFSALTVLTATPGHWMKTQVIYETYIIHLHLKMAVKTASHPAASTVLGFDVLC